MIVLQKVRHSDRPIMVDEHVARWLDKEYPKWRKSVAFRKDDIYMSAHGVINRPFRRLIALNFVPNKGNKKYARAKNRNNFDCRIENIKWMTRRERARAIGHVHQITPLIKRVVASYYAEFSIGEKKIKSKRYYILSDIQAIVDAYSREFEINELRMDGYEGGGSPHISVSACSLPLFLCLQLHPAKQGERPSP